MKIWFVYHSCFVVETESAFLVFDYFKNKKSAGSDFDFNDLLKKIFESSKALYVFASHSHHDHFNREILKWQEKKKDTAYILSSDIKLYSNAENVNFIGRNRELQIGDLKLSTFGSTDEGISFLVQIDGLTLFHAGDLNWWKWPDDTPEEERVMEDAFTGIMDDICAKGKNFDAAFFPVDGRLEQNYLCGGEYFIERIRPRLFIPMHFGDDYQIPAKFIAFQEGREPATKMLDITHPSQILCE